jgi:pimeloyl-ACP methyl ester carboxylesterase
MAWMWTAIGVLAAGLACAALTESWLEARDTQRFPPPGRMVEVTGGRRVHILCKGTQPGPTVVIEQGAGSPSILWWPLQDKIATFARVCTYDRAGYQWSDPAPRRRSLEARVNDLHNALAKADIPGPYVLVAHSFGGPLARLYARAYPDEVTGMVLVDTPEEAVIFRPSYLDYAGKIALFARGLEIAARLGLVRLGLAFWHTAPEGMSPQTFATLKSLLARPAFFRAMADDPAALDRVAPDLRHPGGFGTLGDRPLVVLAHGIPFPGPAAVLEDGWAEGQARLAKLSTRGELIVATHSNHMIQSDEPDLVIDAIRRVAQAGSTMMAHEDGRWTP